MNSLIPQMDIFSSPADLTDLHRYQESRDIYLLKKRFNSIGLELNLFFIIDRHRKKSVGLENIPSARLLFCLIDSLNHRISIIQAKLSCLRKILDSSLLIATLGSCYTSIIISLCKAVINSQGNGIIIYCL